jgi:hypothetical protein
VAERLVKGRRNVTRGPIASILDHGAVFLASSSPARVAIMAAPKVAWRISLVQTMAFFNPESAYQADSAICEKVPVLAG